MTTYDLPATYAYDAMETALFPGKTVGSCVYDAGACSFSSEHNTTVTVINPAPAGVRSWPSRDPIGEDGFALVLFLLEETTGSDSALNRPRQRWGLYAFLNNEPIASVDLLGLYIELWYGNHNVVLQYGVHSKLWLITDELSLVIQATPPQASPGFPFREALSKTEIAPSMGWPCLWALTIGAGPGSWDDLVAAFDRPADHQKALSNPQLVHTFADVPAALGFLYTVATMNQTMNDNFDNTTLEYQAIPGLSYTAWTEWDEFNSNGYISGLLAALGYTAPAVGAGVTGYAKSVPGFVFTTAFASSAALQVPWAIAYPPPP